MTCLFLGKELMGRMNAAKYSEVLVPILFLLQSA